MTLRPFYVVRRPRRPHHPSLATCVVAGRSGASSRRVCASRLAIEWAKYLADCRFVGGKTHRQSLNVCLFDLAPPINVKQIADVSDNTDKLLLDNRKFEIKVAPQ